MQVYRIENPILAFALTAVAGGTNFNQLAEEVRQAGGSVEQVSDSLARVMVGGGVYDLPIGYVLVFDIGSRLLSKEQFDSEYVVGKVGKAGGIDLGDLVARLDAVEAEVSKLTALATKTVNRARKVGGTS